MKAQPERKCIASGEVRPSSELLRFVVGPGDELVFDAGAKLPGRGLWLSARLDMLKTAAKKNLFAKAARGRVVVPDDLADRVAGALRARCLERLGLARRAGLMTQGFEKVRAALKAGGGGVLIEAADASADGRGKIERLAHALEGGASVVALFTAEEIGRAIGRDNAVHVLLQPGKMAEAFYSDAGKLAGVEDKPLGGAAEQTA